jgi:hypothetical protein
MCPVVYVLRVAAQLITLTEDENADLADALTETWWQHIERDEAFPAIDLRDKLDRSALGMRDGEIEVSPGEYHGALQVLRREELTRGSSGLTALRTALEGQSDPSGT